MARKRKSSDSSSSESPDEPGPSTPKPSPAKKAKPSPSSSSTKSSPKSPNPAATAPMALCSENDVRALCARKSAHLGTDLPLAYEERDPSGSVRIISHTDEHIKASIAAQPAWMQEHLEATKDPSIRKVHTYVQPEGAEKPDPEGIHWEGGAMGPFRLSDACLLYCLEPEDLADLAEGTQWLDQKSAAMRALTVHGGFYKHTELVKRRVRTETLELQRQNREKSPNSFSARLTEQLYSKDNPSEEDLTYYSDFMHDESVYWTKPPEEWKVKMVLQYYPPELREERYDEYTPPEEHWYPMDIWLGRRR